MAARIVVPGIYLLAQSAVAVPNTGNTTENTLTTITVPANAMGPNGSVRMVAVFSRNSGGTADVRPRIRFSGASGTQYATLAITTANLTTKLQVDIANRNATNSQVGGPAGGSGGWSTSGSANITSAEDTTAATTIVVTGQNTNSGDTLTLESYRVELFYGA